ncbi:hypothetical protein [Amycolatopsis sp. NPDC051061]|uniref:hypothetical protein n=1 Tax=Amycolatopsis sp. NPDC051061 TaxID=3155042 RepID=UPI003413BAE3
MGFDVCIVTFKNTADRIIKSIRNDDRVYIHDNSLNNYGFAKGANLCARQGTGPLILFINPDGDLASGVLEALEREFSQPNVAAVAAHQGPAREKAIDRMRRLTKGIEWVPAACLAVRRELFEAVDGFDERLFMYGEDIEVCARLARFGLVYTHGNAMFHHDADNPHRYTYRMQHLNYRNLLTVGNWHTRANLIGVLSEMKSHVQNRKLLRAAACLTGIAAFITRTRRWSMRPVEQHRGCDRTEADLK